MLFIFAARYLHILRYAFKLTWVTLGVTVLAEVAGKYLLNTGLTSQFRPKKYYTLSKETLNSLVGDVHELINFFVIETQRVLFVENVLASAAVSFSNPLHHLWLTPPLGILRCIHLLLSHQDCSILGPFFDRYHRYLPRSSHL